MKKYCPNCGKWGGLSIIHEIERFDIRGEVIPIKVEYYRCSKCHEEMMPLQTSNDPLVKAYDEYRRRKGLPITGGPLLESEVAIAQKAHTP